jgi:acetylornithine deacetylase/succinyl-diaminopimelate desuccinylase-like protein
VLTAVQRLGTDQPRDPVLGAASVVATGVDVLPESPNVIPDRVNVTLDWRILPEQTQESLLERVRSAVARELGAVPEGFSVDVAMSQEHQRTYTGYEEVRDLFTPGFLLDTTHAVARAAARAVGRRDDPGAPAAMRPWAFATDGGWSAGVHGIPTVGFAPGEERFAHTNRERLDLEEARWTFGRYPELVLAVQGALAG